MKTEWNRELHLTVRWALFEAMRAADNAPVGDYWDVVTENLIQELGLRQEWAFLHSVFGAASETYTALAHAKEVQASYRPEWELSTHLVADWKRVDSNE